MRKIIHIDMDAFYASVEILDRPELARVPLVVGGSPNSRAVVCAASYKAREFGIRSAMPCSHALRRCPHAVFVPPRFPRYKEISRQVHAIFRRVTDRIEPLSLDEAWIDVTENLWSEPSATRIAERIRREVRAEVGLTCSAGVSFNKFLAKIASDERKPDGLFVITPDDAPAFLAALPLAKIPGVGRVTAERLQEAGLSHGRDVLPLSVEDLRTRLGRLGEYLFRMVRGEDHRPVQTERVMKSLGIENTFPRDLVWGPELLDELHHLARGLEERMSRQRSAGRDPRGRTLTLKVKFFDFSQVTRAQSREGAGWEGPALLEAAQDRLARLCHDEFPGRPIRLLGLSLSHFPDDEHPESTSAYQTSLLDLLEAPFAGSFHTT